MNSTTLLGPVAGVRLPAAAATALASAIPAMRRSPATEALPRPEPTPAEVEPTEYQLANAPHPDSPVGRAIARDAVDPGWNHPLRRLEARLGRPLLNFADCTDAELHAFTDLLLAERHRRDTRWGSLPA